MNNHENQINKILTITFLILATASLILSIGNNHLEYIIAIYGNLILSTIHLKAIK